MKSRLIVLVLVLTIIGCMANESHQRTTSVKESSRETKEASSNSDPFITHQITQTFLQAGLADVRVRTSSGMVTLCGYVNTENQKQQAAEIAQGVGGVVRVANYITVGTPPVNVNKPGGPARTPCDF